jgi:nicotinate-nucleotide adenylyltransferase
MPHLMIYGGTFDPIHHGHLVPCRSAREILGAEQVLLVPARLSPHKTAPEHLAQTTPAQRLDMLRLAIEDDPEFAIDARELSREGPSYTVDTLRELGQEHSSSRFTLLLGADQLRLFSTWREVQEILRLVQVAVLARPGIDMAEGLGHLATQFDPAALARIRPLNTPLIEISATSIRERAAAGLSLRYLVPDRVAEYIGDHRLYQTPSPPRTPSSLPTHTPDRTPSSPS